MGERERWEGFVEEVIETTVAVAFERGMQRSGAVVVVVLARDEAGTGQGTWPRAQVIVCGIGLGPAPEVG